MLRRIRVGRAAVVASVVLFAAPATVAATNGNARFVIGPVAVGHGYRVFARSDGCYTPNPFFHPPGPVSVEFVRSIPGGTEVHTFLANPVDASCNMSTGMFKLSLGKLATIDVTFRPHGRSWKGNGSLVFGCDGPRPMVQPGSASGTFRIDIDPSYFGSVDLNRTPGSIVREGSPRCGPGPSLQAWYGRPGRYWSAVQAGLSPDGRRWLAIQAEPRMYGNVMIIHEMLLRGGVSLFDPAPDRKSATVNGPGGPVTGQLRYSEKPRHPGYGTLSGSLRLRFDLIGTKFLYGARAAPELG